MSIENRTPSEKPIKVIGGKYKGKTFYCEGLLKDKYQIDNLNILAIVSSTEDAAKDALTEEYTSKDRPFYIGTIRVWDKQFMTIIAKKNLDL